MDMMDKCFELGREIRLEQGFEVYVLGNERLRVAVVPELGAKVISLKNLRTGREWMWHPAGGLKLFRNCLGDDFSESPLVGVDECLPTIAACAWQGCKLTDHGEVWSEPWSVDHEAWQSGVLKTSTRLKISPFGFERTIELEENEIQLSYRLTNRSAAEQSFLWAMHPLLRLRAGDALVLPASTRALLDGECWIDALDSTVPKGGCSKLFAESLSEGFAGIHNRETGERLDFEWSPAENNSVGLWLSCGGWHGHEHFAIEPTNAGADSLDLAARRNQCGVLAACGTATWQIRLRVDP
ncbi:MAG TPA: hypothetical protein VNZ64_15945 [Candidatus Acidoferrum sp.]|jgi:hypothetical protein|nr:hypothetical protein [Candidatus Acidoferrum sp.]